MRARTFASAEIGRLQNNIDTVVFFRRLTFRLSVLCFLASSSARSMYAVRFQRLYAPRAAESSKCLTFVVCLQYYASYVYNEYCLRDECAFSLYGLRKELAYQR